MAYLSLCLIPVHNLWCAAHLTAAWCNNHGRHHFDKRCSKQSEWCSECSDPARFHHSAGRGSSWVQKSAAVSLGNQGERSRPLHPSQSHRGGSLIKARHVERCDGQREMSWVCMLRMGVNDDPRQALNGEGVEGWEHRGKAGASVQQYGDKCEETASSNGFNVC